MQQHYRPDLIELAVQQYWAEIKVFKAIKIRLKKNITVFSIRSLTHLVVYIWAICVTSLIGDDSFSLSTYERSKCFTTWIGWDSIWFSSLRKCGD